MADPKTMHDVRSIRSVSTRAMPSSEGAIFLQLHRLASEKLRLEREVELWLRKKDRIEARLTEIEHQMEALRGVCPRIAVEPRVTETKHGVCEMVLEY